jgi:hypothetical protein
MATNENIVTDRSTDGAKPASNPKEESEARMIINLINEPRRVLGKGFRRKVTKYALRRQIDNP